VWLYLRFPLSFREVEELMLERGVVMSYETVRRWCLNQLRTTSKPGLGVRLDHDRDQNPSTVALPNAVGRAEDVP
jgi:hypothetical protein